MLEQTNCAYLVAFLLFICSALHAQPNSEKNIVIVMGMIHGEHRESDLYSLERIRSLIRDIEPDFVLTEIPPDRLAKATQQFRESGTIVEPRVRVFPEYTDALFPLTKELEFEIIPCAAWTKKMNDSRRATLEKLKKTHRGQFAEMEQAQETASERIAALGNNNDPSVIHTDEYDSHVKAGMEPYDRHFNDLIGAGGWENINAAHYALISAALDKYSGAGKRFLITFGSWHKYYIKQRHCDRTDIEIHSLQEFLEIK